jgi:HEAT repeat protein
LLRIARTSPDMETQWLAIRGIGRLKYKDAAPFLKQSSRSRSTYVRANAARALGEIHDVSAIHDLMRMLKPEEDSGVIEQTVLALQMLAAHEAVPLLKTKSANPSSQTRIWILGAVDMLEIENDIPFFARFLSDQDEIVAETAARILEHLTGEDFGLPRCDTGPCNTGDAGVRNAQAWWKRQEHRPN